MSYYQHILNNIPEHKNINFGDTMLIAYVHILENNKDFFNSLIQMGFEKEKIIIFGKSYSTNNKVLMDLLDTGLSVFDVGYPDKFGDFCHAAKDEIETILKNINPTTNMLVMESGGLLRSIVQNLFGKTANITGIELTTQGTYHDIIFPTINVARSDLKISEEPEIIARCAYQMIKSKGLIHKDKIYGIIGNGVIGNALHKYMISKGLDTTVYDKQYDKDDIFNKIKTESDYIIGATGRNVLENTKGIKDGCSLISVSSGDIEFNGILKSFDVPCTIDNLFSNISIGNLQVINGGFPITFDRKNGSEDKEIIITYGLWLIGIIQAGLNQNRKTELIDLNKDYQEVVKMCLAE